MRTKQAGFTLVEISIVLVIIGLLLGGVLKGQALIDSAKVKNLAQDFRSVPTMIYAYQDKFRALPGDDNRATTHLCTAAVANCTVNGDADGKIVGTETKYFWQQLRLASIATGSTELTDADFLPVNSLGGIIGVESSPLGLSGGNAICSAAINGKFVRQLDVTLDDGNTETGALRAGVDTTATVANAALDDGAPYVVCMAI